MRTLTNQPVAFALPLAVALLLCGSWATAHNPQQTVLVDNTPKSDPGVFTQQGEDMNGDGMLSGDEDERVILGYMRSPVPHHFVYMIQRPPESCTVLIHVEGSNGSRTTHGFPDGMQGRIGLYKSDPPFGTTYFAECVDNCDDAVCKYTITDVQRFP